MDKTTLRKAKRKIFLFLRALVTLVLAYIFVSLVLAVFGVYLNVPLNLVIGWKNWDTFKCNARYYCVHGETVTKVDARKGTDMERFKQVLEILDSADKDFAKYCKKVIITPTSIAEAVETENDYEQEGFDTVAISDIETGTFVITDSIEDSEVFEMACYHEMAHIYDYSNGYISQTNEFKEIYNSEDYKAFLSSQNAWDGTEDEGFAIGSSYYRTDPEYLKSFDLEAYSFFQDLYTAS